MNENDYCIKFHDLQAAVIALYYSAYWHPDRQVDEAYLWTAVRDTADIAAGKTAARLGPDRTARPEVGTISWQAQAYVKLGLVRDMMIPADVLTVQQFIGPIPESAPSPLGTIK